MLTWDFRGGSFDKVQLYYHSFSLLIQMLSVVVVSYSQAHTGDFRPPLLKEPLKKLCLQGYNQCPAPKPQITIRYRKMACMGDLVGNEVLVFQTQITPPEFDQYSGNLTNQEFDKHLTSEPDISKVGAAFQGSIENVIDSWSPALLLCQPGARYGEGVYSVMIGGGSISKVGVRDGAAMQPIYHWDRLQDIHGPFGTFNITNELLIGGITTQALCPLNSEKCRRSSESYLEHLGTEVDYWRLAERQVMIQGCQYVGLQIGNVYGKIKGRSLKMSLLDSWALMPDFRILLQPWGLQISLCTGVARRVPLKTLIEEPMMAYIDGLKLNDWDTINTDMRLALRGVIDYTDWTKNLTGGPRDCAIKVITFFLQVLKDTGVDREGKSLRMLWPHKTGLSHTISLKCSKSNLWARLLKDSPSCATSLLSRKPVLKLLATIVKRNPPRLGQVKAHFFLPQ